MGGFIKGIAVGLASFVLGFAALSVLLPTPRGSDPAPVEVVPDLATGVGAAIVPAPPSTVRLAEPSTVDANSPVAAAQPATSRPEAPLTPEVASPPATAPSAVPTPAQPTGEPAVAPAIADRAAPTTPDLPPAGAPSAGQAPARMPDPAPAVTSAPSTAPTPARPTGEPATASELAEPGMSDAAATPDAVRTDAMPAPAAPPSADLQLPGLADEEPAADDIPAPLVAGSPVARSAPLRAADPGPSVASRPVAIPGPTDQPADADAPLPPVSTPLAEPEPEPEAEPEPGPAVRAPVRMPRPDTVPEPTTPHAPRAPLVPRVPAVLVLPVPARILPASEPTLPVPAVEPQAPRVSALPSGVAGIVVRRGGADEAAPISPLPGVTVGRLPSIGAATPDPARDPAADPATPDFPGGALPVFRRFAAAVTLGADERGVGVVLSDDPGAEAALLALPFAVTVAMSPDDPDAPRRAATYRAAGHEIAILAEGLPPLATPSDIAVTLNAWERLFPQAMAVMDVAVNGLGASPDLARGLAAMLAPEGWGVIARRDGVDALLQAARAERLVAAPLYRQIDAGGQGEMTIRRLIDRAAFEAQRQSGVLIAGSAADTATMAALAAYAQNARPGIVLVPASTVMQEP